MCGIVDDMRAYSKSLGEVKEAIHDIFEKRDDMHSKSRMKTKKHVYAKWAKTKASTRWAEKEIRDGDFPQPIRSA